MSPEPTTTPRRASGERHRTGRRAGILAGLLWLALSPASVPAATFLLINGDGTGEGFNDTTAVAPVPGNPGTTLGEQRMNVVQAALDTWGEILASEVPVRVQASFNALECDESSGVLGQAAPFDFVANFPEAPLGDLWYPLALADSIAARDILPGDPDVIAEFNRSVDDDATCFRGITWWYGLEGPAPEGSLALYPVVLHELAHGLGFTSLVDPATGAPLQGFLDVFSLNLEDHSEGLTWGQMIDQERAESAVDEGDLHWVGPRVLERTGQLLEGVHPSGHVLMYAPETLEPGSSVVHWDLSLFPNELMEPFLSPDGEDLLTTALLQDLGYRLLTTDGSEPCTPGPTTLCIDDQPGDGRFRVEVDFETLQAGGVSGQGRAIPLTTLGVRQGGLFWFFTADNPEMLVKILDGCPINDHFWVFYSAGTNVAFRLEVTDTATDRVFVTTNPDLTPAPPLQDTRAFRCEVEDGEDGEDGENDGGNEGDT